MRDASEPRNGLVGNSKLALDCDADVVRQGEGSAVVGAMGGGWDDGAGSKIIERNRLAEFDGPGRGRRGGEGEGPTRVDECDTGMTECIFPADA